MTDYRSVISPKLPNSGSFAQEKLKHQLPNAAEQPSNTERSHTAINTGNTPEVDTKMVATGTSSTVGGASSSQYNLPISNSSPDGYVPSSHSDDCQHLHMPDNTPDASKAEAVFVKTLQAQHSSVILHLVHFLIQRSTQMIKGTFHT